MAADVFEIERSGSSVEVSVIDLIDDGDDAIEELGEAGLDVEVAMVPVSPSLVGRLVAVESLGGIDLELVSVDGVVIDSFVAEAGSGPLLLEIGEPAEGEEPYVYSSEPGLCASFGRPISVDDVRAALGGPNHEIRWFQAEGAEVEEVAEADLVALAIVVTEVVPEHINASVVFATTDTSHPGCE